MKRKHRNTLQQGKVRYIVFKEDDGWYAVALDFNIVESGDDPEEVLINLFEAVRGYIETSQKIKARTDALNQKPDEEYERMWQILNQESPPAKEAEELPEEVYTYGTRVATV